MYTNVSSSFLSKIAQPSRHFEARFYDGNTLLDLEILHIDVTTGTCGGSNLAVGCAFAGYLSVSARYTDIQLEGKELKLELGLLLDDSSYEYIPFGYWTVQKPTVQKDVMTFTAVDRMASKFNDDYSSSLTYPTTIANVLSELSTATGVTINCNLQTSLQMPVAIEEMSQRGALAVIANCLLACAWVDRNGIVNITAYGNSSTQATVDYDYVKEQPNMDEKETLVSGVKVYTVDGQTDTWVETGTEHMITTSNVYTTQTILDATANNIVGLEYNGGSVKFMGNPLLDPSDTVTFNDGEADQYVPCMEITQSFDGGLLTTVTAPGSFEVTESTIQTGPIAQEMERRARATAEAQATADAALAAANQAAADMAQAVLDINSDIAELQDQIDGNITSWFYEVDPTLSNPPASTWTTTADKNNHLGDLYYNTANGHVWRWVKEGNTYKWSQLSDSDITEALALAQHAQDTADSKRRVFFATPVPPYDRGDLWAQGATGDILRCQTAKTATGTYSASDWVKASKYTDDTTATTAQATANNALTMATGKSKIFYSATAPASGMSSGDMWMKLDGSNALYQYNGSSWTLRQFGQGSIVAGSITTNELYGNTISALRSNLGTITAGILQSEDYVYGTGPYFCQEGLIVNLNSKFIMTPKFSVIGGVLRATDGIFSGQITSESGKIGNWTISNYQISQTTDIDTSDTDPQTQYMAFMRSKDGGGTTPATGETYAFGALQRTYENSAYGDWSSNFYVKYDGSIKALKGSIGPFAISDTSLTGGSLVIDCDGSYTNTEITLYTGTGYWGRAARTEIKPDYLQIIDDVSNVVTAMLSGFSSYGRLTLSLANNNGRDDNSGGYISAVSGGLEIRPGLTALHNYFYDTGLYLNATSFVPGQVWPEHIEVSINYNNFNASLRVTQDNSYVSIGGLYSATKSGWIIYCSDASANAIIPRALEATGNYYRKDTGYTRGTAPSAARYATYAFADTNDNTIGYLQSVVATNGNHSIQLVLSTPTVSGGDTAALSLTKNASEVVTCRIAGATTVEGDITAEVSTAAACAVHAKNSLVEARLIAAASGNVGVYNATNSKWLIYMNTDTDPKPIIPQLATVTTTSAGNVFANSSGALYRNTSSSKRYKHDIKKLKDWKKILDIPVVSFVYNDGYVSEEDQRYHKAVPGFIAEEVEKAYPIAAEKSDGKVEDWNVRFIIPPMLAVEQDHEKRIKELEEEIRILKGGAA